MIKKLNANKKLWLALLCSLPMIVFAQSKKIDGVEAVVGNEIVLQSDIDRDYEIAKQNGQTFPDKCSFLNNMLVQKMVLNHAKNDTLVKIADDRIKARASAVLEDFRNRATDVQLLQVYGVKTIPELKNLLENIVRENALIETKKSMIEENIDASPEDVKNFFEENKSELPRVNEEVELAHIVIYPEITETHKQQIIDSLKQIKKDIENGESFATKATLFSQDPGSASQGGLYKNIKRGKFVPEFDAVAFNLEEGQISDPVETEFGYHIIKLDKRLGQAIDVRHILLVPKPTQAEIDSAKVKLEKIKQDIKLGKITFKEAALQNSVDKYTRFNGGVLTNPQTGEDRFERSSLPYNQVYALAGLQKGDISDIFESEYKNKKVLSILQLIDVIPAHQISLSTDYTRLKNYTLQKKKQEVLYDWIRKNLPNTYIKIGKDYQNCNFEFNWLKK
ncbi:peptidylprolyl isomerase [Ornithobacterium rhinotracheale]|uniref:Peptidylprolyl isomerase n=1 Tax=Ornithobacterium rhinotracheale TaxID=28251 RepID=A0A3R5Y2Z2_ORNRH|nr:peptidylprolyl isomerase [Ornithobacterium rhinotracheale]QAR30507.1 peptidylprolyl isomerase [Ornithobacterium rhinotracheale]